MSYIKSWDVNSIASHIHRMAMEASDPRNDGWTASGCKKELFQIKEHLLSSNEDINKISYFVEKTRALDKIRKINFEDVFDYKLY